MTALFRVVLSHPCDRKKSQGWGTVLLWVEKGRKKQKQVLRLAALAQDDSGFENGFERDFVAWIDF
jgi:hypothetical protein